MRYKTLVKSEKRKTAKDKRRKRGSTLSSAIANYSGNSQAGRKKIPKIFGSSKSNTNTFKISKFIHTNSSKLKTGISTDISEPNNTQEKTELIPNFEISGRNQISPFNLQKANQKLDIFMSSGGQNSKSAYFSNAKKLKSSITYSPINSDRKEEHSANKLNSNSLKEIKSDNFPNKNLIDVYHRSNSNYNNYYIINNLNNNYICNSSLNTYNSNNKNDRSRSKEKSLFGLSGNSDECKINNTNNKFPNFNNFESINDKNYNSNLNSKIKEKNQEDINKENSLVINTHDQQMISRNVNLNNPRYECIGNNKVNNISNIIFNNNLLLIKANESFVNNDLSCNFDKNINYIKLGNNISKDNYINVESNSDNDKNFIIKKESDYDNDKNFIIKKESDYDMIYSEDNNNKNAHYIIYNKANENQLSLDNYEGDLITKNNENNFLNNFYEVEGAIYLNSSSKANAEKNIISIQSDEKEQKEEEQQQKIFNDNNNNYNELNFNFDFQQDQSIKSKFHFTSSIFKNNQVISNCNEIEYFGKDSNNIYESNNDEKVNYTNQTKPTENNINDTAYVNLDKNQSFYTLDNSRKIDCSNYFNIPIESNKNNNYEKSINYAEQTFNQCLFKQETIKQGFKITNVIKKPKKTLNQLDTDFNETRFLYEREVDTFSRKNAMYMNNQSFVKPRMRKILLDWINEISAQLHFKRSTFHLSIALLDCFLSKHHNLEVDKLQLSGVTCLIIAAKYEEIIIPNIQQMANATESACSHKDIITQETLILQTLNWKIDLTNFSTWINHSTLSWDNFIKNIKNFAPELMLNESILQSSKFRAKESQSLCLFRAFTQYIDIISFDVEYLLFSERILCLSVIYLLLLKYFGFVDFSLVSFIQLEHVNHLHEFNLLFDRFLEVNYSLSFANIFEIIQYASCYMETVLDFEEINVNDINHWEETLQIQTYNPNNFDNDKEATKRKNELGIANMNINGYNDYSADQ